MKSSRDGAASQNPALKTWVGGGGKGCSRSPVKALSERAAKRYWAGRGASSALIWAVRWNRVVDGNCAMSSSKTVSIGLVSRVSASMKRIRSYSTISNRRSLVNWSFHLVTPVLIHRGRRTSSTRTTVAPSDVRRSRFLGDTSSVTRTRNGIDLLERVWLSCRS